MGIGVEQTAEKPFVPQHLVYGLGDFFGVVALLGIDVLFQQVHHGKGQAAVTDKQCPQSPDQNGHHKEGDAGHPGEKEGVHHPDNNGRGQTEEDQVSDPHPTVKVHGLFGIVPPAGVEELFQIPAGEVFQAAAQEEAGQKHIAPGAPVSQKAAHYNGDKGDAAAIDGAPGPQQEAAVDQTPVFNGYQHHFHHPAQKGKKEKEQRELIKQFHKNGLLCMRF